MNVRGLEVTDRTQCAHYHSELDIVAIRFKCCGEFYACAECHGALADHPPVPWPRKDRGIPAILCGNCRNTLTIKKYLQGNFRCPHCDAPFNPGCARHYHLYFEM